MASSRLIGAVAVRDGRVVKSYGYRRWRPAGTLPTALRNLDRWNVDEILVVDISRRDRIDPTVLAALASSGLSTPVLYGGGIRGAQDLPALMASGVDRVLVERTAWVQDGRLDDIAERVGAQAVVVGLPLVHRDGGHRRWDPRDATTRETVEESMLAAADMPCSELLVIDVDAEGHEGAFARSTAEAALAAASHHDRSMIWFGGIDADSARWLLAEPRTSGVALGNPLHERELAVPLFREALRAGRTRSALRRTGLRDA